MRIKRFNESFDADYIQIGDFETTIEVDVDSPTYGKYFMTKVLTVDLIKACENMKYLKSYNIFESKSEEEKEDLPKISDLKIVSIDTIEGKNKWHHTKDKLIHMVLDLGDWEEFPSDKIPNFYKNIKKYLPSMHDHRCSENRKGGFFFRVKKGTWLGHITEHVALEIQTLAGYDTGFGRTRGTGKKGEYNVIFNYEEKSMGILAAKEAVKIVKSLIKDEDPKIKDIVKKLKIKKNEAVAFAY